jgi:hypothetical protein
MSYDVWLVRSSVRVVDEEDLEEEEEEEVVDTLGVEVVEVDTWEEEDAVVVVVGVEVEGVLQVTGGRWRKYIYKINVS